MALDVAQRSIVLLKNENQLLPLSKKIKTIAVIGPLGKSATDMKGFWSVAWDDDHLVSLYEGLQNKLSNTTKIVVCKGLRN